MICPDCFNEIHTNYCEQCKQQVVRNSYHLLGSHLHVDDEGPSYLLSIVIEFHKNEDEVRDNYPAYFDRLNHDLHNHALVSLKHYLQLYYPQHEFKNDQLADYLYYEHEGVCYYELGYHIPKAVTHQTRHDRLRWI